MSLTSFLKIKDVREKFKQELTKPELTVEKPLLAPPLTKHYSLVGTAFDYILRFYLKRLNPQAVERSWVAEEAVKRFADLKGGGCLDLVTGELFIEPDRISNKKDRTLFYKMERIVSKAKSECELFLRMGTATNELATSALLLAKLDIFYRSGYLESQHINTISNEDIKDLLDLTKIVPTKMFGAKKACLLNPTFGEASRLVRGADADLVIDDTLVEVKTTKKLEIKSEWFNQLIGYYCLYKLGGIDDLPQVCTIKNLAIYFSRHAYLHSMPVQDCIGQVDFPKFLNWFKNKAEQVK